LYATYSCRTWHDKVLDMRYVSNTLDDWIVKPKRKKWGKGKTEEN
jgi:hypothetical protein